MSFRHAPAGLMCVAAVAIAACLSSCGSDQEKKQGQAATGNSRNSSNGNGDSLKQPPPKPIFAGWENPAVVICLTGETHGYLEPCGCSENQSGGISRRADLFRQIDERGWQRTALDLGGTLRRNHLQSQIKFESLLDALGLMSYGALGMGIEELQLDPGFLLAMGTPDKIPLIGSNTVLFGGGLETPQPHKMITVGDIKIGVVSIVGNSYKEQVVRQPIDENSPPDVDLGEPSTIIEAQLSALDEENGGESPNLMVLLSHAELEESRKLAANFPRFDLVVSAGGVEDPSGVPEQIGEGKTMLVTVGQKGKHTGVVGYFPDTDRRLRFELIELDKHRFQDTPAMREVMRSYQSRLEDERIADQMRRTIHPTEARFVGAETCGKCHTKAYGKWSTTGHASAYKVLETGRKGEEADWISRVYDPECLCCHVTGWNPEQLIPYESGFVNMETTPHLAGQQCENCHGPGSIHTELEQARVAGTVKPQDEELIAWRKSLHLNQEIAEKQICNRCHDLDNSPHFEFAEYWKKIAHPGRD